MWLCVVLSSLGVALCGHVDKLVYVSTCVRVGYNVVWVLGWSGGYIVILQMLQIFTMLSACLTAPCINELTKTVEDQQKAQANVNSVLLLEVANINLTKLLDFDAHIKKQAAEIASLVKHYNFLYNYATTLYYTKQAGLNTTSTFYTIPQTLNLNDNWIAAF